MSSAASDKIRSVQAITLAADDSAVSVLRSLLGTAPNPVDLLVVASLEEALETRSPEPVIVVLPAPDSVIARDIADGVPPSKALARWWKAAAAQMACFRRMRQRLVLLDEASLARCSPVCVDALAHRLERDLSVPDGAAADERMQSENLALFRVMAGHLLKQDPQVRRLAEQIDALTVSDRDRVGLTPERLDAACADLLTAQEETDAENALLRETVGELRETLSASQRDTERLRHAQAEAEKARSLAVAAQNTATEERAGLEAALDDTRRQLAARASEVETAKRDLSARKEDVEKLRRALSDAEIARDQALAGQRQTAAALETAVQERAMLEQSVQNLQEDLVQSRQQIETGMVDAQMRETALESEHAASDTYRAQCKLREEVMGAAILDLSADADRQLRQLETAQATALDDARQQLEAQATEVETAQRHISALKAQQERQETALREASDRLRGQDAELAECRQTIAEREAQIAEKLGELERIYASRSWRAVSAVRTVRHSLKR